MGLNLTHGCWDGAYSAFMRWRTKLAEVAGLPPLLRMEYFWLHGSLEGQYGRDYGAGQLELSVIVGSMRRWSDMIPERNCLRDDAKNLEAMAQVPPIRWDCLKPRPLLFLLQHSDCDGDIPTELCGPLADDLATLVPLLPDGDGGGHIGNWREKTQKFIDGLRAAAAAGESVGFY